MKLIKERLRRLSRAIQVRDEQFPWVLLCIAILCFGVLIPTLGFYWDDWLTLFFMVSRQSPTDYLYASYRPLHAVTDAITYSVLGLNPIRWHILSLVLRWGAAVMFWLVLKELLPRSPKLVGWSAALFLIYPSFNQQASAVIYRQHWTTALLFLLSLWTMLHWRKRQSKGLPFLLISVGSMAAHLTVSEYFVALELVRPLLLWITFERKQPRERFRSSLINWVPFLLGLFVFVFWRLFAVDLPEDPNPPEVLLLLQSEPMLGAITLAQVMLKDLLTLLVGVWASLVSADQINLSERIRTLSWIYAALVASSLFFAWKRNYSDEYEPSASVFAIAFLAVLLGLTPAWLTGRQFSAGLYSDRLSIPAMLGASLLISAAIHFLVTNTNRRAVILACLVGLSVGQHVRTANDYRWEWRRQLSFFEQLRWRVPSTDGATAIISDGSATGTLTDYNAGLAVNLLYSDSPTPNFWWFHYSDQAVKWSQQGFKAEFYNLDFQAEVESNILLRTAPGLHDCIWVLSSKDALNQDIPLAMRELAQSITPIREEIAAASTLSSLVAGNDQAHPWCEYFQKADLAAQFGHSDTVLSLQHEAGNLLVDQAHGYEIYPFVWANLENNNTQEAIHLTELALRKAPQTNDLYCALWNQHNDSVSDSLPTTLNCTQEN